MTIIAQLSDPHVDDDPASVEALSAAVRAVLALSPAPDAVLLSGDVANLGDAASYERANAALAPLPMPVHVLPGNHDDRAGLRRRLPAPGEGDAPFRYAVHVGAVRLVVCDTTVPGRDDGRLDGEALAWLASALAADGDRPTLLAMHHPPALTGIAALDAIGLPAADRAGLGALLARSPSVVRVVAGHVHRATFGVLGACPVMTCPSTYLQARLELGPAAPEIVLEPAPAAIGVHVLLPGGSELVSHVHPV